MAQYKGEGNPGGASADRRLSRPAEEPVSLLARLDALLNSADTVLQSSLRTIEQSRAHLAAAREALDRHKRRKENKPGGKPEG